MLNLYYYELESKIYFVYYIILIRELTGTVLHLGAILLRFVLFLALKKHVSLHRPPAHRHSSLNNFVN
jgi:hypothetical protein